MTMIDRLKSLLLKMAEWATKSLPPPPGGGYQPSSPSTLRLPPPGAEDGDSLSNAKDDVLEIIGLINRLLARSVSDAREFYLSRITDMELRVGVLENTVSRSDVLAVLGFQHRHRAKYVDAQLAIECGICGRNRRNEAHTG